MGMPRGHNPTRSIAWKIPPVPINLLSYGGSRVTAGRTAGPRPPQTARCPRALAMSWQRSGSATLRQAAGGSHVCRCRGKSSTMSESMLTAPAPRHPPKHPKTPIPVPCPGIPRAPPKQLKGHVCKRRVSYHRLRITASVSPSPYHRLHSHSPSSQDFHPCGNFLFPFLSALLQAPSPKLPCLEQPTSPQRCCSPAPIVRSPSPPHWKYDGLL